MIATQRRESYEANGYLLEKQVFSPDEVAALRDHYMHLRESDTYPGDFDGVDIKSGDPLKKYPRMIHMHRFDEVSLKWLIDDRLNKILTEISGVEPFAVQTMLYFKPAGARGQALHQDQYYLKAQPGTCVAAWLALDDCDEENGCMRVVQGSHNWPILCTEKADTTKSFTDVTVPVPEDANVIPAITKAGDVLFFHGMLVHGSYPNESKDRFRRALIGHYITGNAEQVATYYHPVLRMDGSEVELEVSKGGGACGVWADSGIEMVDQGPEEDLHE
ncbi:MAG TPA: phytanoyl-CoA dioxygenase family protein [Fimbriimonadaceae bacterium]|jgi:ectoine hydroxylase-related dioxygenase (phytanoyl-CoA dioxygenase family)